MFFLLNRIKNSSFSFLNSDLKNYVLTLENNLIAMYVQMNFLNRSNFNETTLFIIKIHNKYLIYTNPKSDISDIL